MRILAIETSCDETAMSIVEAEGGLKDPRFSVVSHLVSSQIKIHRPYGGVVPNLAKREHIKNLPLLFKKLVKVAGTKTAEGLMKDIDLVAVTVGPGLEPALWTGINFAEELAKKHKKTLIGANHMEGHLYSFLLKQETVSFKFPAVGLIVSGGHTILVVLKSINKWKKIGETVDDAVGEAFDKVARILELPYPGGPEIEKLAKRGDPKAIDFPRPMLRHKNYEFSFSGLKTSVLYYLRDHTRVKKANVAASFQKAAIDVLTKKTFRAVEEFGAKSVILAGGVAANKALRKALQYEADSAGIDSLCPEFDFNTDNASMIAAAAYIDYLSLNLPRRQAGKKTGKTIGRYKMEADNNLNL